jgi:hypothetical protein
MDNYFKIFFLPSGTSSSPVPKSPGKIITSSDDATPTGKKKNKRGFIFIRILKQSISSREPHVLAQRGFNDVVSDLDLFKKQTEVLGFRSKGWNLLHRDARVATFEIVTTNLIFFPKKEIWYIITKFAV